MVDVNKLLGTTPEGTWALEKALQGRGTELLKFKQRLSQLSGVGVWFWVVLCTVQWVGHHDHRESLPAQDS